MRTEKETITYLSQHYITPIYALMVGQFLQKMQRPLTHFHLGSSECTAFDYAYFCRWWHDVLPKFKIGDKVEIIRESEKSLCIVEAIIQQDTKPIGCYCDVRNIDKGTIQRVNQNKIKLSLY